MKSLQVVSPARPCIFDCPFCISKAHREDYHYVDIYTEDHRLWVTNFTNILRSEDDLKYIVITGTNEAMQTPAFIDEVITLVKAHRPDIQVELQTRCYRSNPLYKKLDVVAYSISDPIFLDKIEPYCDRINRYVLILTDKYNGMTLEDIIKLTPKSVTQITAKVLQDSGGINQKLDSWIAAHRLDEGTESRLKKDIANYSDSLSIRFDDNCMDAEGRYMIFREDGNLYRNWDQAPIV